MKGMANGMANLVITMVQPIALVMASITVCGAHTGASVVMDHAHMHTGESIGKKLKTLKGLCRGICFQQGSRDQQYSSDQIYITRPA